MPRYSAFVFVRNIKPDERIDLGPLGLAIPVPKGPRGWDFSELTASVVAESPSGQGSSYPRAAGLIARSST